MEKEIECIETILKYLEENRGEEGNTYYYDKDGYEFSCDMGYFYEGLYEMKKYLLAKVNK